MRFLVNASNIKGGGGAQVASSIISCLSQFQEHSFVVIVSDYLKVCIDYSQKALNCSFYTYNIRNSLKTILFGRDAFLDSLVKEHSIDAVFTIFGPSRWRPRCSHLSGFARAQVLKMDSPYYRMMSIREILYNLIVKYSFYRSAHFYWTESPYISALFSKSFPDKNVITVSNTYNQVFDNQTAWRQYMLPTFSGATILLLTAYNTYKNLEITIPVARHLKSCYPDFRFRFVLSLQKDAFPTIPAEIDDCFVFIGTVGVEYCPSLYVQSDILLQPSLLECFSAVYPEAMKMNVPILTTDLPFAKAICGDAAYYYSPLDFREAADKIYELATNNHLRDDLISRGEQQLKCFNTASKRAELLIEKLVEIAEGEPLI